MLDSCKMVEKQSEAFHTCLWHFCPSLKQNFIAHRSSKLSDCIFEIHQLWQSGFSQVYSNCCCSCSFIPEIIKIGPSSHKMYSNNIVNFQESTTVLNACAQKSGNLLKAPRIYAYTLQFLGVFFLVFVFFSVYIKRLFILNLVFYLNPFANSNARSYIECSLA